MTQSFIALGDSYTIGEGVAEEGRWPVQLASRLRAKGIPIDDPRIVARTGWTTEDLLAAIVAERIPGQFDLVTLLAGVNDQYQGFGIGRFRESFGHLIRAAMGLAKLPSRLIVLSIPDWGVTPFAGGRDRSTIAREIDAFNDVGRTMVATTGARYLDMSSVYRRMAANPDLLAADGLHPSAMMYSIWLDQLVPMSLDALSMC